MGGTFGGRRDCTPAGEEAITYLTLDSSVIIAALRKQETKHSESRTLLEKVRDAEFIALEPYTVLIEVVAAVRRRTGNKDLAIRVRNDLQHMQTLNFLELTLARATLASEIAGEIGVRGMDAVVIQIAREFNIPLVSLDGDMIDRARTLVETEAIPDLLK
jgi:predicted nucleic acid-binding protein